MANPKIKVKRSSVEGKVPAVTQLERGELAVNSYDGKVYILRDQFSVGIATTTHTINPWDEPGGVGAGISYSGGINVLGISTFSSNLDVDGTTTLDALTVDEDATFNGDVYLTDTGGNSSAGPILDFYRNSSSAADADYMGQIKFQGENDAGQKIVYAKITGKIQDASDGTEDGLIEFANKKAGSNNITARLRSDSLQLLNGTNFTVNGTSTFEDDVSVEKHLTFGDSPTGTENLLSFGAGDDLTIFHSGNNSFIKEQGTGSLTILSNKLHIRNSGNNEEGIIFSENSSVQLYFDNTKRLETSNTGITVTGTVAATAYTGDGSGLTNVTNIEEGNTKAEVSDTGSNGRFFVETEGTERFSVDSTGDIVFNTAHDNVFNANGNFTIDYKMYNSTKVRWMVQSSQLILYLQAGEDYPLNIWGGGDSTKDIKFFRSGDVKIGNTIKMHGPSGIVTATGGMTIGNYNMPSTIGAQDTVLKSDGTNVVFGSAASATFTEKAFTATQGQTVFTDTTTLPTYVQVFVNGIKIRPTTDFTKSGASITLSSGATAGDEIDIVRFD